MLRNLLFLLFGTFFFSCQSASEQAPNSSAKPISTSATCKDSEGNVYPVVTIGDQVWMAENLRLTRPNCEDAATMQFTNGIERGPGVAFYDGGNRYAYYNNNPALAYGVIYSYRAIQQCTLCPAGFRLPTKTDYEALIAELGGKISTAQALLKSGKSGFNAEIGGRIDDYGSVLGDKIGFWWTTDAEGHPSSKLNIYNFELSRDGVVKLKQQDYRVGNYVRCIKK